MTQVERLTKEFQELDRVTPRPLDHQDYAICAIQFANEMYKEIYPRIMKQLERAAQDYDKLSGCFDEIIEVKKANEKLKRNIGHLMTWIGKEHPKELLRLMDEMTQQDFINSTENLNRDSMIIGFEKPSVCDRCNGSGFDPYPNHDTTMRPCPKCSGV